MNDDDKWEGCYMLPVGTTLTLSPEQLKNLELNTSTMIVDPKIHNAAWIDVKDRLPSDNKEVLAGYYYDNKFEVIVAWYSHSLQMWIMEDHDRLAISHWMPLPGAPK